MRSIMLAGLATAVLLAVAGCASPGTDAPSAPPSPASLADLPQPNPAHPVLAVGTVLEQDDDAILCVGPVAESAPPQCGGPSLIGWEWDALEHEESNGVRWVGGVAINGDYDATASTFTITGEPTSAAAITLPAIEVPAGDLDDAAIQTIQSELMHVGRADFLSARGEQGTVALEVMYDDGSLQAAIDEIYGPRVVFVFSALRGGTEPTIMHPPMDTAAPVITGEAAHARLAELPTPSATEPVIGIGTVLEADSGTSAGIPMLCQMVLTSYPPQCGGPEVVGWDWDGVEHESSNGVRWTTDLALRVSYDGQTGALTLIEMLDLAAISIQRPETPTGSVDEATMTALQADFLAVDRPDVHGVGFGDGIVLVDVVYDDGSLQTGLDDIYGPGVVHVTSWLLGS